MTHPQTRVEEAFDRVLLDALEDARGGERVTLNERDAVAAYLFDHGWNIPQSTEDCRYYGHNDPTYVED